MSQALLFDEKELPILPIPYGLHVAGKLPELLKTATDQTLVSSAQSLLALQEAPMIWSGLDR